MMAMPVVLPGNTVGPAPPETLVRTTLEDVSVAMVALGLPISMLTAGRVVRWDWRWFWEVVWDLRSIEEVLLSAAKALLASSKAVMM
jgi:hypothetical protein